MILTGQSKIKNRASWIRDRRTVMMNAANPQGDSPAKFKLTQLSQHRVGLFLKHIGGPCFLAVRLSKKSHWKVSVNESAKGSSSNSSSVGRILMRNKVGQEVTEEMSAFKGVVNLFIVVLLYLSQHIKPSHRGLRRGRESDKAVKSSPSAE